MRLLPAILLFLFVAGRMMAATHVEFRSDGIALLNNKPFFPLGIWVYNINPDVMADLHDHHFNTIVGNGFAPKQMQFIADNGMMAVPCLTDEFFATSKSSPALLAWYLSDEPEGHHQTPPQLQQVYKKDKLADPNHPFGIDHYLYEAMAQYKDCCDFTMTDFYPIMANRDGIIPNVGKFVDEGHRVHGPGWPHWAFIQVFGGKQTDGGKWAQPLPFEVRCMTFIALAHRAAGILYFSYWPQAPQTWASISVLNHDIDRIMPWLLAPGEEQTITADVPLDLRAKKVGKSYLIIAVNHDAKPYDAAIHINGLKAKHFSLPFESRTLRASDKTLHDHFEPYAEHVYLAGDEPVDSR
jgi:hypothetical protein